MHTGTSQGFDDITTLPGAGWVQTNHSTTIGTTGWFQGNSTVFPAQAGAATSYIGANFNNTTKADTISNWLLTPPLTLQNGAVLTFWTRTVDAPAFPDRLQVRMSTNGASSNVGTTATDVGDFTTLLLDINPTYTLTGYPNVWTQFTVTVSGVASPTTGGWPCATLWRTADRPERTQITSASIRSSSMAFAGQRQPQEHQPQRRPPRHTNANAIPNYLFNLNHRTRSHKISIPFIILVSRHQPQGRQHPTPVTPTPTPTTPTPTPTPQCTPTLTVENFDDITTLPGAGWVQTNHSATIGTTGWFQGNSTVFPAQGGAATSYIGANFNNTTGANTISNWLLSPPVTLRTDLVLTFFTRTVDAPAFGDRLQVRLSTSGSSSNVGTTATDVGDFTTLLLDINPTYTLTGYPNVWTAFTVTLSGIPSPITGRVAFRYFVENGGPNGANSDYIGIDTFQLTGICGPTPTPGTPTPTPTATPPVSPTPTPTPTPTPSPTPVETPTPSPTATPTTQAINLSTRMRVQTGDNVGIGGLIITGSAPKEVLLRAIGPSLSGSGIVNPLADPVLELHGSGGFATITNNNWRETQEAAIIATGIPPSNDLESAILVTLNPGAYTAIVRGNGNTSGIGLVEVYDLTQGVESKLANLSTRALVGTADNIVIAGFLLSNNGTNDRVIVRGIGPSLPGLPASAVLADPALELRDDNGALLMANNDWQDDAAQAAEISAAGLAPTNTHESAIAATLPPGPTRRC